MLMQDASEYVRYPRATLVYRQTVCQNKASMFNACKAKMLARMQQYNTKEY